MKKLFTLFLALVMSITALSVAGCGGSEDPDDTLIIDIQKGGYGTEWLTAIKDSYVAETGKKVTVSQLALTTEAESALVTGESSTDIYFTMDPLMKYQYTKTTISGTTYDCLLEDLTSFIETDKIAGENKTIKEKINAQYLDYYKITRLDGTEKVYTLPWAIGLLGIVKNNKVWQNEWQIPNTTDKFIEFCQTIKDSGAVPFAYSEEYSYYNYLFETFVAQYEGVDNMDQMWEAKGPIGSANENKMNRNFLSQYQGIRYAYEVMAQLLQSEKVGNELKSKYQFGNTSKDHIGTQTFFLNPEHKIAMMMSGDWILNEMKQSFGDNIDLEFIKTPVISALGNKLGITDDQLSAIIDYVDGTTSSAPEFISSAGLSNEEVISQVRAARNIIPTNANSMAFYIPAYSNAKDAAKDFIKYMLSDKGLAIYQSTLGYAMPYEYDWLGLANASKMTNFIKKGYQDFYFGKILYPTERNKSLIFAKSELRIHDNHDKKFENEFSKTELSPAQIAEQYFKDDYRRVSESWTKYMTAAGL